MLKRRIIPVLTFNGLSLVKTKNFNNPRTVGNPIQSARIFNSRNVDELVFIDIMATVQKRKINLPLVKKIIDECFMPITIGGGIKTSKDISDLLLIGADKVLIKTSSIESPEFISEAVSYFGSQCISIAVDVVKKGTTYWIYYEKKNILLEDFIKLMNKFEVGEFIVNAVHKDGAQTGFDIELYKFLSTISNIPIVALGGAGKPAHFSQLTDSGFTGGIAASSIFYYTQFTPLDIKKKLRDKGIPVRL